jgi:RNA polymerase I-specific transcription initiation factor RRN7
LGGAEDSLLTSYFPLPRPSDDLAKGETPEGEIDRHLAPTTVGDKWLRPGEGYQMYNSRDTLGTLPRDYELVLERSARWVGVRGDFLGGVVETYERRLQRWWKRRAREDE